MPGLTPKPLTVPRGVSWGLSKGFPPAPTCRVLTDLNFHALTMPLPSLGSSLGGWRLGVPQCALSYPSLQFLGRKVGGDTQRISYITLLHNKKGTQHLGQDSVQEGRVHLSRVLWFLRKQPELSQEPESKE